MLIRSGRAKNLVILVLIGLLAYSCKPGSDQLMHEVVMHYCDMHYRRYQPIDFERTREYYAPFERTATYIDLNGRKKKLKMQQDSLRRQIAVENKPEYLIASTHVDSALNSVEKQLSLARQDHKPQRTGWMVVHRYNFQPSGGPMVRNTTVFIVSDNQKRILEVYDK